MRFVIPLSIIAVLLIVGIVLGKNVKAGLGGKGSVGIGKDGIAGTGIFPEPPLHFPVSSKKHHSEKVMKLAEAAQHFNGKQLLGFISTYTENEQEMKEVIEVIQEKYNEEQFKVIKHEVEKAEEKNPTDVNIQRLAGDYYFSAQNYKKARGWYEKAAEQGDKQSKYYLSVILLDGLGGTPKDEVKALKLLYELNSPYYRPADELLHALFEKDKEKGRNFLINVAENGSHEAQNKLAYSYYKGLDDYPKDFQKAIYWFKKAALENKDALSAYRVAYIYGHEFPKTKENLKEAITWYQKAKELGENPDHMDHFAAECERQMRNL